MVDSYGREINYLRISVTDRCNLRCRYCMPEEGIDNKLEHLGILSLEEIARLVKISTQIGIRKVRLTGGEPLVRRNLPQLVGYIKKIPQIDDIAITTNGILFSPVAQELKDAGLKRINFSLDSLKATKFSYITRRGKLADVEQAIFKALELNLHPVKINTVIIKGFNDDELLDFARLAFEYPLHVRFIEFMPIGDLLFWDENKMINSNQIKDIISQKYQLLPSPLRIEGSGPAKYYELSGGQGSIGFISPMSNHFCSECNRIRMTADGKLRGCLYDYHEIDLKQAIDKGASDIELMNLFLQTIDAKPARHKMNNGWGQNNQRKMYQIGG